MTTQVSSPASGPPYRVGMLSYTKAGLVTLFAWMLWGDFCFTLMEMILPLQLKELRGAANEPHGGRSLLTL